MTALTPADLLSLEQYARERPAFRERAIAHKRARRLAVGPNATWCFEDRLTIQYQVQEMLRLERMFEPELIQEELDVYNPLIPDGHNWKATFMVEYSDENERRAALAKLIGIEKKVWLQVEGCDRVYPIANEDLERETEDKTSAVHFMRFAFTPVQIAALRAGATLRFGIDDPRMPVEIEAPAATRASLLEDFA